VLIAVGVVARLPQLLSPNLLLEGDESIVGLMGLHVARGREFPLFLYGQKYGLAIVEAPMAALSFAIAGAGAVPLKLAILGLWLAGVVFSFLAFARVVGTTRSFWITLTLVVMPAWAATSMKAWSGYVTAFTATAVVIFLITGNDNRRTAPWLAAGVVTAVVFFSQPLWLPGLLPIVLYYLVAGRRPTHWVAYAAGTLAVLATVSAIKAYGLAATVESWYGPTAGNPHLLASVAPLVEQVYVNLTGSFYFAHPVAPGRVTAIVAGVWMALLAAALLAQCFRFATRRFLLWSHLLCASVLLTLLANWVLLEARDARYMLAMNVPLVFLVGVELSDLVDRYRVPLRLCVAAVLLAAAVEALALREFAGYTYMWWTNAPGSASETKTLQKVVGYLQSRGISHAYSANALLQWTITFYSDEAVIARWKESRDRYPPYIAAVDRALEAGEPVAIVGYRGYTYGLERLVRDPAAIVDIDGKYFVYLGADRALLERAGFRVSR
jgi:hypothetical protein